MKKRYFISIDLFEPIEANSEEEAYEFELKEISRLVN